MAPRIEFVNTGTKEGEQQRIRAALQGVLPSGNWRINLVGAHDNDIWEIHLWGSQIDSTAHLDGSEGQHSPAQIAEAVTNMIGLQKAE